MTNVPSDIMQAARKALIEGYHGCEMQSDRPPCSCDHSKIDGCFKQVQSIEAALLAEREKFQICGYQRRLKWQTPEAEWFSCSTREATDPFESVPSFEYRAVYTAIRSPAHD